jgi:hypothetical protein
MPRAAVLGLCEESYYVTISERKKELKRRRHRRKKLAHWKAKLANASPAERAAIADKIRDMTPGADKVISAWGLEDQ